ncbi:unnamed protein product, partial [Brassica oleracea var. botrytis]
WIIGSHFIFFFSLPYKEISQWEQVSSLFYSLHACPIQPGSVLKLDRLARWKRGSVVDRSYLPRMPRLLYPPATISAIKVAHKLTLDDLNKSCLDD